MIDAAKLYRFEDGRLLKAEPPSWLKPATTADADEDALLQRAGAHGVETLGDGGDTISIFRTPDKGFLITFWDIGEAICYVIVASPADFLAFKAHYIAPLAHLAMASDQFDAWRESQSKVRRYG